MTAYPDAATCFLFHFVQARANVEGRTWGIWRTDSGLPAAAPIVELDTPCELVEVWVEPQDAWHRGRVA